MNAMAQAHNAAKLNPAATFFPERAGWTYRQRLAQQLRDVYLRDRIVRAWQADNRAGGSKTLQDFAATYRATL